MFAVFPLRNLSEPRCQRSQFFQYKAKPDLAINLTKDRLEPEPARTPAPCMESVRLFSREMEDMGNEAFVNRKFRDFLLHFREYAAMLWEHRLPAERDSSKADRAEHRNRF